MSPASCGYQPRTLTLRSSSAGSLHNSGQNSSFNVHLSIALGSYPEYHRFGGLAKPRLCVVGCSCLPAHRNTVKGTHRKIYHHASFFTRFVRAVAKRQQPRGCVCYSTLRTTAAVVLSHPSYRDPGNRFFFCSLECGVWMLVSHLDSHQSNSRVFSNVS